MGRIPRSQLLEPGSIIHKIWHSHNKEFNLQIPSDKERYLKILFSKLTPGAGQIHNYTLMDNHVHEVYTVYNQKNFSDFMRDHHSLYAKYYNGTSDRKGRISNDRPKTKLVLDELHEKIVTLYGHANPLKDRLVKDLRDFPWSTHLYYGYGKDCIGWNMISFPKWYVESGSDMETRRKTYLILMDDFIQTYILSKRDEMDFELLGI